MTYERTLQRLERLRARFSGRIGLAARDLSTGEEFLLDHRHAFPTASAIKVPILYQLFRRVDAGDLSLDDRVELTAGHKVEGSGVLRDLQPGLQPTVRDIAMLMIIVSDNTATNMAIDLAGGPAAVTEAMRELGLTSIVLHRKIQFDQPAAGKSWLGEAAPFDLMRLAALIGSALTPGPSPDRGRGEIGPVPDVGPGPVPAASREGMLAIMRRQHSLIQFPRFLGYNPFGPELGVAQPFWIANKTGSMPGVRADMGLVGLPGDQLVAFCVVTEGSKDTGFTGENEGEIANGIAGRILLEHWWPEGFVEGLIGIESPHLAGYV
jgi:beta-lactamase class A